MNLIRLLTVAAVVTLPPAYADEAGSRSASTRDLVPNEATAIRIAEAIWLPKYGERIYAAKPFAARLQGGVWFVSGSKGAAGAAPEAQILARDGRVLRVAYGQ